MLLPTLLAVVVLSFADIHLLKAASIGVGFSLLLKVFSHKSLRLSSTFFAFFVYVVCSCGSFSGCRLLFKAP